MEKREKIVKTLIDEIYDLNECAHQDNMDNKVLRIVNDYVFAHLDKSDGEIEWETFIVWKCKILQNWKYLISTTLPDGMYYEVTYNGDKKEFYIDAYKKFENKCIKEDENDNNCEYVDLGLLSGTKWATCNLGATRPEEYGDYYMWGSVTPNTNDVCDWAHVPFNNGSSEYDKAYFASVSGDVCPGGVLANEYDAAYVATGGKCHMPTEAQMRELLSATTNTWTTENGVYGRKFTATNGKSIFIPASGFRYGSSFCGQGSKCCVWGSSLLSSNPLSAWYLYSYSSGCYVDYYSRYYGFSVRPVIG